MTHPLRPPTIDCPDWAPDPADERARRCVHYGGTNGTCRLQRDGVPVRLMCTEWLKAKGHVPTPSVKLVNEMSAFPDPLAVEVSLPPPVVTLLVPPPPKDASKSLSPVDSPDQPLRLVPAPPRPRKAADIARDALALGLGRSTTVTIAEPPPFDAAKAIDPADLASLEAAHPEVTLYSEELGGSVTLVATPTNQDRLEMTFRDAATLRLLVDTFPGSRVIALARKK